MAATPLASRGREPFEFPIRAGEHTSEWSHDRPELKGRILHRRAPVATSFAVEDPTGNFDSHTYVCKFSFPDTARITTGEIEVARIERAPQLTLDVKRISLLNNNGAEAVRGEWVEKLPARQGEADALTALNSIGSGRWRVAAETEYLQI